MSGAGRANFAARAVLRRRHASGLPELATGFVERKRDVADRAIPVYGVAVHCTGSGLITKALAHGADCLEYAIAYYLRPYLYFAHYVVGFDGTIAQIADEHDHAMHIGLPADDARPTCSAPGRKAPRQVRRRLDGALAEVQVAVAPLPGEVAERRLRRARAAALAGRLSRDAARPGARYTTAQHDATAALVRDVATRWELPDGWERTGRLACHEDISPLTRTNKVGGWDPGVVRAPTWFDWDYFVAQIDPPERRHPLTASPLPGAPGRGDRIGSRSPLRSPRPVLGERARVRGPRDRGSVARAQAASLSAGQVLATRAGSSQARSALSAA